MRPHRPAELSNLNYLANQIVPNAVTVRIGTLGRVCLYTNQQADLVVDINGYYDSNLTGQRDGRPRRRRAGPRRRHPARHQLARPRQGEGHANTSRLVNLVGLGAVPAGTTGVVLNVTSTEPEGPGFLTVYPATRRRLHEPTQRRRTSTTRGSDRGQLRGGPRARQRPDLRVHPGPQHIVIDRVGTFGAGGTNLLSRNPVRLVDTRTVGGSSRLR